MQAEHRFISVLVKEYLTAVMHKAFGIKADVLLQNGPTGECEYVSPSAMKEFNVHKNKKEGTTFGCKTVVEFAKKVEESYFENEVVSSIKTNQKGFLQIKLQDKFIEDRVNELMNNLNYPEVKKQNVVVDFSSPNIAKEMHVGHLRSTIIGESMCRILEYMGYNVTRANHVGDWGTQFGMLIAYMREAFPDYETNQPDIKDLDGYYKAARARFDSDPAFKKLSQETVVRLQAYDEDCIKAWKMICSVSRDYFQIIYKRLGITLEEYGESYYNKLIPGIVKELEDKGMIVEDSTVTKKGVKKDEKKEGEQKEGEKKEGVKKEGSKKEKKEKKEEVKEEEEEEEEQFEDISAPGIESRKAKCIFIEKYSIPLIVVKSDGGYNYDSTDLAAINFRIKQLHADRIIYITDAGQREHFEMIIAAAKRAGWIDNQRCEHMGFGVILGEDGKKFKTRGGVSVRLLDLLNEARDRALAQLKGREKGKEEGEEGEHEKEQTFTALKPEEYEEAAEKLGMAAIKYFDLKQNRVSDYRFSFEKMLDPKGNTAIYLIYAYVRMCSIIRKSGLSGEQIHELAKKKPFKITHPDERNLAALLVKFYDVLNESAEELAINKVTDYIYELCVKVQENYKKYRIVGDEHMETRIILCEAIRKVLEKSFFFVGIVPIEKI
jgi:arginyl-tRNA synthetase